MKSIENIDAKTFERVYELYGRKVFGFAYRMLGDQSIAEDFTHETFMVIILHPERYQAERGSLLTFLCAIVRNHVLKYFRRQGVEISDSFDKVDHVIKDNDRRNNPLSTLLEKELAEKVSESISTLPVLQREALILREFQDLSYEEISIVTNSRVSVIKARLYRARQTLKTRLSGYMKSRGEGCHEMRKN